MESGPGKRSSGAPLGRRMRRCRGWGLALLALFVAGGCGTLPRGGSGSAAVNADAPAAAEPPSPPGGPGAEPAAAGAQERDRGPSGGDANRTAYLSADSTQGYRLQPGDPVMVMMRGTEDIQVEDIIDPDGYIVLPFIGRFRVEGMTPSTLEDRITEAYVPDYYRYLTVTVLIQSQRSFYVKGEVRAPTRYPYVPGVTLMRAVSAAGGPTDFANRRRVTISRGDQVLGPYSLREIQRDPSKDVPIEPEDVIDVPQKPW